MSSEAISEARRQINICNACRYCEGYCAVFPAINRHKLFTDGDINHLANLCHNCRACHYSCQYAEPHEFRVSIPQSLGQVRQESWIDFAYPKIFARWFSTTGVALSVLLVICISLLFLLFKAGNDASESGTFYSILSHTAMVSLFAPSFLLPIAAVALALRRYWTSIGGDRVEFKQVLGAFASASRMRNLSGGKDQGCNYESADRFTHTRKWGHHLTVWGFLLCFASTASATVMHYGFDLVAPYSLLSLPKLLGIPGGVLLVLGCSTLAILKTRAERSLAAAGVWGGEMAFVLLLGSTGLTGLMLYVATGSSMVEPLLALHLGCVLTFFLTLPYSKMVHGFFRLASLIRQEQITKPSVSTD